MSIRNFNLKVAVIVTIGLAFGVNAVGANNWNVPADKKERNSYIKFDAATASQGEAIYTKNCASCHGNPGKNNSMKSLTPVPPDLSSTGTQSLTDGELFYILSNGRMVMPSFQNSLSEEERWKVISYIRSFNKSYTQTVSKFDPNKSKLVKTSITYDEVSNKIHITVIANEKSGKSALKDAEIALFTKRYFGRIQVDKTTKTDKNGVADFIFPKDLPGDKTGMVELVVKINDQNYGEIEYSKKMKLGIPTDKPALNAQRSIWNVVSKAPLWIIGLYSFGVLCFALIMLYIFNNLRKLLNSGKTDKKNTTI